MTQKRNWRKIFFYTAMMVFAVIGGAGEAYIYYAYLPESPVRIAEAISRAVITQIAIVFFGVAAVQAVEHARGFWRKFGASLPANIATLIAALVAFWFMRGSAIMFRDGVFLGAAEAGSIDLPLMGNVSVQWVDIYLIAALPFFQVGMNWLAPLIVRDAVIEDEQTRAKRQAAEIAEAQHAAALSKMKAGGIGAKLAANVKGFKDTLKGEEAPATEDVLPGDSDPNLASVTPGNGNGKAGGNRGANYGGYAPSSNMMTTAHFRAFVEQAGVKITPEEAVIQMKTLKGCEPKGNTYQAPKAQVFKLANQVIALKQKRTQSTGNDARIEAEG